MATIYMSDKWATKYSSKFGNQNYYIWENQKPIFPDNAPLLYFIPGLASAFTELFVKHLGFWWVLVNVPFKPNSYCFLSGTVF